MPHSFDPWEFADSKPGWAALTTLDETGYPHTVAIGYRRDGESFVCGCRPGTRKVRNIERNPKVSLMIHSGQKRGELKGAIFQGDARVVPKPGTDDVVHIRIEVKNVIVWDK